MFASRSGQTGVIELLLASGADISAKDNDVNFFRW
jgi:hypothetical protein